MDIEDMKEIKQDVKDIKAEVKEISGVLLRNTVSLELHEKRTTLAEKRLDSQDTYKRWELGLLVSAAITIGMKLIFR